MDFLPLNYMRGLFASGNDYIKTPNLLGMSRILSGQPEYLSPDSWDAYNVYLTTPQVYAVIQRRGYLLASGIWKHYDKNGEVIENSEIVKLLENPNPLMKGNDHIRLWNENKCVYGNNYEYLNKAFPSALPSTLFNLPPAEVEIITTGKTYKQTKIEDIISGYKYGTDPIPTNEINHTRVVNGKNSVKGESPLVSLYMPISNIRGAYGFRNVLINKKGALGILSNNSKDSAGAIPMTEPERKRLEVEYQRQYGISDEQSQVIMTNSSLAWQSMTFPTKDLMLFEEIDSDFLAIIDAFGLNANIFSRTNGSTFENLNQGIKQAYQSTIIPESEELAMNRSLMFGLISRGEWLELDYSHIPVLQENEKEKAEVNKIKAESLSIALRDGVLNPTQYAEAIGIELVKVDPKEAQLNGLAQAQAQLRGTVGGLDGIISLNTSVSLGQMTRETAVNTLVNYYGYERIIAESMITPINSNGTT